MALCSFCKQREPRADQRTCKECHAAYVRDQRRTRPMTEEQRKKANCRSYLKTYIKRGLIQKGICFICGTDQNIEAHHHDYALPLSVVWLCRGHHVMVTKGFLTLPERPF